MDKDKKDGDKDKKVADKDKDKKDKDKDKDKRRSGIVSNSYPFSSSFSI